MCRDELNASPALPQDNEPLAEAKVRMYAPLTLAFVGDAVFSLMVRRYLTQDVSKPAGKLHKESIQYVNAAFQAEAARAILPLLNENEEAVFKRGRNAHSAHSPKNQSSADYRYATGLEALFGYLYLCGENERAAQLFDETVKLINK